VPDLFTADPPAPARTPLAERLRPASLGEVVGQPALVGPEGTLTRMLERGHLPSLILWGPPGTGKTTIARLLADAAGLRFVAVSAVMTSVADLKAIFAAARAAPAPTLLFVDEIHRFNRSQQDSFLGPMEDGTVTLIGATTENPSFELNAALLSRAQVLVLDRLDDAALEALLARAEASEGRALPLTPAARAALIAQADGDGRFLLGQAETLLALDAPEPLDTAAMAALLQRRLPVYDKDRDGHYDLISALHKSLRGSDPDAALYWLARMLVAGEQPLYILRRLVRFASEDVGLADPDALTVALSAKDAYDFLGSPEGELAIAEACLYLATAPKSNAAYVAQKAAWKTARESGSLAPPKHILNAPTRLLRDLGHGAGYAYDHDAGDGFSGQDYWPEKLGRRQFYTPTDRGRERAIAERLVHWAALRRDRNG
jgi:putative ATPase